MDAGAHLAAADAWEINFWFINVLAEVVPHAFCGSVFASAVTSHAWRHSSIRSSPTQTWASRAQELVRQDTSFGCWDTGSDKKWKN